MSNSAFAAASIEGTGTAHDASPELEELARALQYDPKLIYDYIHNHIDYVPYYGLHKGATLTYLDGRGNDADQAALMVALLKISGYNAWYIRGKMTVPGAEMSRWLGLDPQDPSFSSTDIETILANGHIPYASVSSDGTTTGLHRYWVGASIRNDQNYYQDYAFDPAFKDYTYYAPAVDLQSVLGYSRSEFLTKATEYATTGSDLGSDFVQNMDESYIRSKLDAYATNVANVFKSQHFNKDIKEIIGGRQIVQTNMTAYSTTVPYQTEVSHIENEITDSVAQITITHYSGETPNTSDPAYFQIAIKTYELGGKRLTLTYNAANGNRPELKLEGELRAWGTSASTNSNYSLEVKIAHPYNSHSYVNGVLGGSSYAVIYNIYGISSLRLQKSQRKLDAYRAQGLSDSSEQVLGETLSIMGLTWEAQVGLQEELLARQKRTIMLRHHSIGLMAQEMGYYVSVGLRMVSLTDKNYFRTINLVSSALEHGILEQTMGTTGASTVKLFQVANVSGTPNKYKIYKVTKSASSIINQLPGYSDTEKSTLSSYVQNGYTLYIPENGQLTQTDWQWKGSGYMIESSSTIGMHISGKYHGGYGVMEDEVESFTVGNYNQENLSTSENTDYVGQQVTINPTIIASDPVDMAGGSYLYDNVDLSLGGNAPLGLSFARSYNSGRNYIKRALSHGWTHNYDIYLETTSHGKAVLGMRQSVDAASFIAGTYVIYDIFSNETALSDRVTAFLAAKWVVDQLIGNAAVVHLGNKAMEYIKLPDGSYSGPPGITTKLVRNDSSDTYSLEERFGTKLSVEPYTPANTNKKIYRIAQLSDVDGNTMRFSYEGDNLKTVTDAFGRTLTLGYTDGRLTSVVDSEGRSVFYAYTNGDLTTYTDPESKNWGYSYLSDHRLLSLTNPMSITTVTNYYDSLGRVNNQVVPRQDGFNQTYSFYFSGYRNVEQNPALKKTIYEYDEKGRNVSIENALGHKIIKTYDGQDHVTSITDARGKTTTYHYNSDSNLDYVTNALNKITDYQYDPQLRLSAIVDPLSHGIYYEYDGEHHLTRSWNDENNESKYTYYANGMPWTYTDGKTTVTTYTYDAKGNPETSQTGSHPAVTYDYDNIGRLTGLWNQANQLTSFQYDKGNLRTLMTDPATKSVNSVYDNAGRLQSVTDRNQKTTTYTYTPTNKVDTITYHDASTVKFNYDGHNRLYKVTVAAGITDIVNNDIGSIASVTNTVGLQVSYTYNENEAIETITLPGGKTVTYEYDDLNRVKKIRNWLGQEATYDYDDAGRLTWFTQFNGIITSYTYDNANRLKTMSITNRANSAVASYAINTRDGNGNITQVSKVEPLASVMTTTNTTYTYNSTTNRIQSSGTSSYVFDDEGQLKTVGSTSVAFDYAHRLTTLGTSSYVYDGLGNRVQATRSGTVTRYLHDQAGNVIVVADGSNNISKFFIYGPNGLIALVTNADQQTYCYHFDPSGNTVAITDQGQAVQNKYTYSQFGLVASQVEAVPQPFKFAGQYGVVAEPNNNYYMRARYYDANIGRFISEDPIGFDGGDLNLYAYVGNNPINRVDHSGLIWETVEYNYSAHATNNWIRSLLNRVTESIGRGLDPSIPFADPNEAIGIKRDLIQVWRPDPNNPARDSEFSLGTIRSITQTYTQYINPGPSEVLINDPSAEFYYQWNPWVDNRTYQTYSGGCSR